MGDTITYTITLTDNGPDSATSVQVTDPLPAGVSFVSATPSQGTYDSTYRTVDGGDGRHRVPADARNPGDGRQSRSRRPTRRRSRSADQFDPDTTNNTASVVETPQQADLALTKTVSNPTPNVGDTITYTITLSDNGPDGATNAQVTDLIPSGLSFVSATPSQGTYDSTTGLWTVGTVTTAAPQTLVIQATVRSPIPQTNTATITHSDQFDPNPANNNARAADDPHQADLVLTKTVDNPTPNVGGTVTFTITLLDLGPNNATNVSVSDPLPAGLQLVSDTPSQGSYDPTTGQWVVDDVSAGASATLVIQATVVSPSPQTNTATITRSQQFDPNPGNNTASVVVTPQQADLALSKTVSNTTPNVGDTLTYTVTLTDIGPDSATNVRISDLLPTGVSFVSATASQGTYDSTSGLWTVGTVNTGTPQTLVIQAMVESPDPQTNTAICRAFRPVRPRYDQQHDQRRLDATAGRPGPDQDAQQSDAQRRGHDHLHRHPERQRPG